MKNTIIALIIIVLLGLGVYFWKQSSSIIIPPAENQEGVPAGNQAQQAASDNTATTTATAPIDLTKTVIGKSVEGRDITAYHYGAGDKEILFVGGIHGGYEWNTALVAYEAMSYFDKNPTVIPSGIKVTVIPVVNPDGLFKTVGKEGLFAATDVPTATGATVPGRYNANTVDLNRNFDCDWQASGVWQKTKVSGGSAAFSEPESLAIKNYVEAHNPIAAVVWYSSAGGVFSSNCHDGVLSETTKITNIYAKASGYPAHATFNFYEITGDMVNWLAKEKIPAISVLLTNHTDTEWSKNQAGIDALLKNYTK
jgi:hypothetical protein